MVFKAKLAQLVRWMALNQEVPCSNIITKLLKNILLVLLDKALYVRVVVYNCQLLSLHYENDILKDMIAALQSEYIIYTKFRLTKSLELSTLSLR